MLPQFAMKWAAALIFCCLCVKAVAQTVAPVGMVDEPCGTPLAVPEVLAGLDHLLIEPGPIDRAALSAALAKDSQVQAYGREQKARAAQDWADLCHYRADNQALLAAGTSPRVVFIGDSITEYWGKADPTLFDGRVIDRGISGQTSAQMLLRFEADVVALRPKLVHILAGTNDIAGNTGPTSVQDFKNNIRAMVEIARAHDIAVVLGSIPPAQRFFWRPQIRPVARIDELNAWLADYARQQSLGLVDYHAALVGARGEFPAELSNDGVHPNRRGYAAMRALALPALEAASAEK